MPYKKKVIPGSIQFNKLIAELPEKREKIKAQVQFRHDLLESQKRINYQNEFDRLQGAKKLPGLDPHIKTRMQELQKMARQSLKGDTHRIYSTKF
jgi:hypothetical protein